jgi:hypothetical protein
MTEYPVKSSHARARSLAALFVLLAALGIPYIVMRDYRPSLSANLALKVLSEYSGEDLDDVSDDDLRPLCKSLNSLDPIRAEEIRAERKRLGLRDDDSECCVSLFSPSPRYVWRFSRNKSFGYLVFERGRFTVHPGTTSIRVALFDKSGAVVTRSEFTTGWRRYLDSARLAEVDGVLCVEVDATQLGADTTRQYYALIGDRLDLVRLEEEGSTRRNAYYTNHFRCGPEPPRQTAAEWESDLSSPDKARVWRALVWLGGCHLLPLPPGKEREAQMEPEQAADLVREVRARPAVIARLKELEKNGNDWERAAARIALNAKDYRWWF